MNDSWLWFWDSSPAKTRDSDFISIFSILVWLSSFIESASKIPMARNTQAILINIWTSALLSIFLNTYWGMSHIALQKSTVGALIIAITVVSFNGYATSDAYIKLIV